MTLLWHTPYSNDEPFICLHRTHPFSDPIHMPAASILHVSYDFIRAQEDRLDTFTAGIVANTYGNDAFPNPPVTEAALTAALGIYTKALAATVDAGPSATAAKNIAKAALIILLRKLAVYVQSQSNDDLAVLLSSGFRAASTNRARSAMPQAIIRLVAHAASGSLLVVSDTLANVKSWDARWKPEGAPDSAYLPAANLGAVRKMTLVDLPILTRVTLQTRGVGGTTGYGNWSDPVTHPVT